MARWKPIESAPIGRPILVDGGTIQSDLDRRNDPVDAPIRVIFDGKKFDVDLAVYYAAWVRDPLFWTDLPERHITLALPRPPVDAGSAQEFDL